MLRILRDTNTTLRVPWLVDGTATTGQTITVAVNDLDGVSVASGSATEDGTTGFYEFTLNVADVPDVALLDVVWTNGTQSITRRVEVVGGWLFTEPQARAFDANTMTSSTDYPDDDILAERDRITDIIENLTGRSWVPRYRRYTFRGSASRELWIGDAVYSEGGSTGGGASTDIQKVLVVTANGSTVATSNIKLDRRLGVFYRTDTTWPSPSVTDPYNITVDVEYGLPEVTEGVDWVALWLLRDRLVPSDIPDRAKSWTDEFGNIALDTMPTVARDWIRSHNYRIGIA